MLQLKTLFKSRHTKQSRELSTPSFRVEKVENYRESPLSALCYTHYNALWTQNIGDGSRMLMTHRIITLNDEKSDNVDVKFVICSNEYHQEEVRRLVMAVIQIAITEKCSFIVGQLPKDAFKYDYFTSLFLNEGFTATIFPTITQVQLRLPVAPPDEPSFLQKTARYLASISDQFTPPANRALLSYGVYHHYYHIYHCKDGAGIYTNRYTAACGDQDHWSILWTIQANKIEFAILEMADTCDLRLLQPLVEQLLIESINNSYTEMKGRYALKKQDPSAVKHVFEAAGFDITFRTRNLLRLDKSSGIPAEEITAQ